MTKHLIMVGAAVFFLYSCSMKEKQDNHVIVNSPDDNLSLVLNVQPDGAKYSILSGKDTLIGNSPFQIEIENPELDFTKGLQLVEVNKNEIDETYPMISGKKSENHNHYKEKVVTLQNENGNALSIELRAYNDGLAMRQKINFNGDIKVTGENTLFDLRGAEKIFSEDWHKCYENLWSKRSFEDLAVEEEILFPALIEGDNSWILITEAAIFDNYPGTHLKKVDQLGNQTLKTMVPQDSFTVTDSLISPWRAFIVGDKLNTIVESTLVENLNPPSRITDVSWIEPGVATFPWWGDHFVSGNEKALREYVDMASEMDWEWIEFDVALVGTNAHTTKHWLTTDWIPDFVEYANNKGLMVYGWDEMKELDTPEKREFIFQKYKDMGIDGIKVDFIDSDSFEAMKFREDLLKDAADFKLMVSFHGATIPRGQRRTWPHIMTREAVRGAEYHTLDLGPVPSPSHNTILPFTRNVVGAMDYTPTTFSAENRTTTYAHELALAFVFESGWQVLADRPETYLQSPAKDLLRQAEAAWDDIQFIDGYPGDYVVLGRKKGDQWFVAAINSGTRRTVQVDLNFLEKEISEIELYTDGENDQLNISNVPVQDNKIEIDMKSNGGFVFTL